MNSLSFIARVAVGWLVCGTAFGQSTFGFSNYNPLVGVNAPVFDAQGVPLAGPNYLAELWGSANSNSLSPLQIVDQGSGREIIPFSGGGYFYSTSGFLSVLAAPPSSYAWLQVRAWDARLGSTYEEVIVLGLGGYGESPLFYARGGNPYADPPEVPPPLIGLQSFSLRTEVPEPSTWALLALGGTVVWWTARRRAARITALP
jgi:hypothetical protein